MDSGEDVIVKWKDGSKNCVCIKYLKAVIKGSNINRVGTEVKMYYRKRWYFGTVLMTEREDSQEMPADKLKSDVDCSSDDEPLINLCKRKSIVLSDDEEDPFRNVDLEEPNDPDFVLPSTTQGNYSHSSDETICIGDVSVSQVVENETATTEPSDDRQTQRCEVIGCNEEVFSACVRCMILNCYQHFLLDSSCENHTQLQIQSPSLITGETLDNGIQETSVGRQSSTVSGKEMPESFVVDGAPKEGERQKKKGKYDKKKYNKVMKDLGHEYKTQNEKKIVSERKLGPICNTDQCMNKKRDCHKFTEEYRRKIFENYWVQGNINSQRQFIARHVDKLETKRKTAGLKSRRQATFKYYLTLDGKRLHVCRQFFLNTLNITERTLRMAIGKKLTETGTVEKDHRGGRSEQRQINDQKLRELVEHHIDRFPRVESHYCRQSSTREYLHSDLSVRKMYDMFLEELQTESRASITPSFSTYLRVFRSKNLSFFHPKKDQCSLCAAYQTSNQEAKLKLFEKYDNHQREKKVFREKRSKCKDESKTSPTTIKCATFDLQQVINLPISNESAVFYKRRLSVYNFTIYDMTTGDCHCYTWHEAQSKRGSSEISTALYIFLKQCDDRGIKKVYLFADGCSGQNRNSITAATLLYVINNSINIEETQLHFSVPNHGQSEDDSAHSAISYAIGKAGDIFTPAQLIPIIKLARRKKPYYVTALEYSDFLNFKKLASDLRLLSLRKDNCGQNVNWTEMTEFSVVKREPTSLFFKSSHTEINSRSITLKRNVSNFLQSEIGRLNESCPKISKEKHDDLLSLTLGDTPVIRLAEHVEFYMSLPY